MHTFCFRKFRLVRSGKHPCSRSKLASPNLGPRKSREVITDPKSTIFQFTLSTIKLSTPKNARKAFLKCFFSGRKLLLTLATIAVNKLHRQIKEALRYTFAEEKFPGIWRFLQRKETQSTC